MRILVPVDGQDRSLQAIDFLKQCRKFSIEKTDVEFFCAIPALAAAFSEKVQEQDLRLFYEGRAQEVRSEVEKRLQADNIEGVFEYAIGDPARCISEEAARFGAEMIVMGTRGRGARTGFLFGSVSNAVLAATRCPILMLRGVIPEKPTLHVAVAVDGSEWSDRAVKYLTDNRDLFGADVDIRLIHAVPQLSSALMPMTSLSEIGAPSDEDYTASVCRNVTAPYKKALEKAGFKVSVVPLMGPAGGIIAEYVSSEDIDLVLMGSHGYGKLKRALLGSVAISVASASDKPLLIIR